MPLTDAAGNSETLVCS